MAPSGSTGGPEARFMIMMFIYLHAAPFVQTDLGSSGGFVMTEYMTGN